MYTLDDYYKAAGVEHTIAFAPHIGMDKTPRPHQISGLNLALRNDKFGLFDDPGTGKTLIAHAFTMYWVSEGEKVLICMPPTLRYQYSESLHEEYPGSENYFSPVILDQGPKKREQLYKEWKEGRAPEILIVGIQLFRQEFEKLDRLGYKILIVDEAHCLRGHESSLFSCVNKFLNENRGTGGLLMTGTPLYNELKDGYSPCKLLDTSSYRNYKEFDKIHCRWKSIRLKTPKRLPSGRVQRGFKIFQGYVNQGTLQANLYRHARRVLGSEVNKHIKVNPVTEVPVKLTTTHTNLYQKLIRERFLELAEGEIISAVTEQSLRQKCLQIVTCPELFTENFRGKNNIEETVRTLMDTVNIKKTKIILFLNFRSTVEQYLEKFKALNPAAMYGGSSNEKNRKKFLFDDSCRLLIANPESAGVGFNFQSVCHTVIFGEPTSIPGQFKQAVERVVRGDQKEIVNIYILKALGTLALKATKNMRRKAHEANKVNRDKKSLMDDFRLSKQGRY